VRHTHVKVNRAFKVIPDHSCWCRQKSRTVCRRNVQLMPTLFLKRTKIRQRENGKFVDFSDHTQVWRRPSKKRALIRMSTNGLYCQKLDSFTYIFAADSIFGLYLLLFTQLSLKVEPTESKTATTKSSFTWKSHSRSLWVIHFASVWRTDGQTDGRTDGFTRPI